MGFQRHRERSSPGFTGTATVTDDAGNVIDNRSRTTGALLTEVCDDYVGDRSTVNFFNLTRHEAHIGGCFGKQRLTANSNWEYNNYPIGNTLNASAGHLAYSLPSLDVAKVLAMSSPSRPIVDLPVGGIELKDLPSMIRHAGRTIRKANRIRNRPSGSPPRDGNSVTLKDIGEANLAWQFGWRPLIQDLTKLLDFQSMVAKRERELEKLASNAGLRRRVQVGHQTLSSKSGNLILDSQPRCDGFHETTTSAERWATVVWRPSKSLGLPTPDQRRQQAFRSALGLDLTISTVWELLPWSWLIDWFSNVGDFLSAHRNTVPAYPTMCAVMTRVESTKRWTITKTPPGVTATGTVAKRVLKTRSSFLPTPQLSVGIPFLGAGQLSILGSLAVTRRGGWAASR